MDTDGTPGHLSLRTNTELLLGLRDTGNDITWRAFVERYNPVLVAYAQRLGLPHEPAMDAAQEALITFLEAFQAGKYEREKGRLRSWLFGHATNAVRRHWRKGAREHVIPQQDQSTAFVQKIPDEHSMSEIWEAEWRQAVLQSCLERLRSTSEPRTMRAFELFVLKEWPADKVADEVGISRDAVFQAKRRLMKKMTELLATLEHEW